MPPEETALEALERLRGEFWEWADKVMGLYPAFFQQLEVDDDWSFLIKWQAVLETCANHLLTTHFSQFPLAPVFAYLSMSDPKGGKLAFISACDLLPKEHRIFIRRFSEMRNHAVHDIKNFGFTFRNYVDNFDKKERNSLIRQIGFAYEREGMIGGQKVTAESIAEGYPRGAVALSCRAILTEVFARDKTAGDADELTKLQTLITPSLALQFEPLRPVPIPTTPPHIHQSEDRAP